ncbi:nucleotide-binding universal stress UspA family protein [Roseivirga pacifica]|uniref:Nucleotide-binding universal stress protein, UspA family n=1 Tax=Roseivirga pacifica TaxID=1267423 RepID=A0A1I0MN88_9BACT|nr:universal stress protein [Roseivirga pacifica]MCO6359071.1 universal stress protein [Roseivirga pacifica]MCO6365293.1 universal stress protein [Roseivirga pacifica]MCO6371977.1 universal stress protein [Roseivirga pacifica]MCO6375912.1 universal stress protein [Roseivirga pacifica]MCO6379355.1 universal stress protein [Roseivirga pacifica]
MNRLSDYSRMLVAMDLTKMDESVVSYASVIARAFNFDSVYFLHVTTSLELPQEIHEKYGDMMAPVDETLETEMNQTIKEFFDAPDACDVKVHVATGNITNEVLKYSKVKMVDLILLGRKAELTGSGLHSKKIAKSASASILFVPEKPILKLEKLLIPIDYSKYSEMAFMLGVDIQKHFGCKLLSNHVYRVPTGYYKSGKTYEEFADIMLENTKKDCDRFFSNMELDGVDYEHTYALDDDPHPADKIYRTAVEEKADMIVLGSKGRSGAISMLIGSVAERLVMEDNDIPLLLVKKRDENIGLLEALFRI